MTTYTAAVCLAALITLFLRGERASESEEFGAAAPAPFAVPGGVGANQLDLPRDTRVPAWFFQAQQAQVPRLTGLSYRDAQRSLAASGLLIRPWFRPGSYNVPNWAVVDQETPTGSIVPTGTAIDVQVSLPAGPQAHHVGAPLVRGLSLGDASRIAQELGLGVEVIGTQQGDPNALVISQTPGPEVQMLRGSAVLRLHVAPSHMSHAFSGLELPRATRPEPPPQFTGRTVPVPPPGSPSVVVVPTPRPVIVRERRSDGVGEFLGGFFTGLALGALTSDDDDHHRYRRHRRSHHVRHSRRGRSNRGVGRRR